MTAAPAAEPAARPRPKALTVALAAASGQSIEYYDFFLYGTAATLIFGKLFFPDSNPTAANLASFATFAAGFPHPSPDRHPNRGAPRRSSPS